MLKLKKIGKSEYATEDGKIIVEKDYIEVSPYYAWFAYDVKSGQSVVDCEFTLREIKERLEGYLNKNKGGYI